MEKWREERGVEKGREGGRERAYPVGGVHCFRDHGISRRVQVDAHAAGNFLDIHETCDLAALCPGGRSQAPSLLSVADLLFGVGFVLVAPSHDAESAGHNQRGRY